MSEPTNFKPWQKVQMEAGGLWHVDAYNTTQVIEIRSGPDENGRRYVDGRHSVKIADFCMASRRTPIEQKIKNARLGAAARDLLGACEFVLECLELHERHFVHFSERDSMKARLTQAIEKAGQNAEL